MTRGETNHLQADLKGTTDVMTEEQRRRCMSKIRGKDTKPERQLRSALWAAGVRYRKSYKLPGRPDITIPKHKLAIFVDGCFWHGCPLHSNYPKNNAEFWRNKLDRNRERDKEVNATLLQLGWTLLRFWEHEISESPQVVVSRVCRTIGAPEPN